MTLPVSCTSHYEHHGLANKYVNDEHLWYSGDDLRTKVATSHMPDGAPAETDATYQLRSTPLGGEVVAELGSNGGHSRTFIRANGTVIAESGNSNVWMYKDPLLNTMRSADSTGGSVGTNDEDIAPHELDATGKDIGFSDPYAGGIPDNEPDFYQAQQPYSSMTNGVPTSFKVDGLSVPKRYFEDMTEFAFGSIFGLIEAAARASAIAPKLVSLRVGGRTFRPTLPGAFQATTEAIETGRSIDRTWAVNSSWSIGMIIAAGAAGGGPRQWRINDMVAAIRKLPLSFINEIINANNSNQSASLIFCHAAQETTFDWQIEDPTTHNLKGKVNQNNNNPDNDDLGLFQIQRGTANGLGLGSYTYNEIRDDAEINTMLASTYLENMINKYGSVRTGLGAYKAGPTITDGRIKKKQSPLSTQGEQYADEILACKKGIENYVRLGNTTAIR